MVDNYLLSSCQVEYTGLTGEIKFDADGFRTHFPLDLMEKFHNRLKKTAVSRYLHHIDIYNIYIICNQVWTEKGGVNYTLTATEMIGQAVMKLQNKTLRVTTTTVRSSRSSRYHHHHEWCQIVDKSPGMKQRGFKLNQKGCRLVRKKTVLSFELNYLQQLPFSVSV